MEQVNNGRLTANQQTNFLRADADRKTDKVPNVLHP
jgi:hypothetical protein